MPPAELAATLEHRSGLLGLAGTADMRAILAAEAAGDETAALAIGVYLHRLRASIAAMVAALGGLDVLVFTGGVGENAPAIRRARGGATSPTSGSPSTRPRTPPPATTARSARAGRAASGRSSSAPARTSRSSARCARCWGSAEPR